MKKLSINGFIGTDPMASVFGYETFGEKELNDFLSTVTDEDKEIEITINSGGGSVDTGWLIYDKLVNSGKEITTIGEGMVGSIATIIFLAGKKRKMYKNSTFFIHMPYAMADGTPLTSDRAQKLSEELSLEDEKIINLYLEKSNLQREEIVSMMEKETRINSEKALEYGFVNEVVGANTEVRNYKLVALINKKNNMDNKVMEKLDAILNKVSTFFKNEVKNMEMPVTDTNGNTVMLYVESETEDLTGKPAYVISESGEKSVAPDGVYKTEDGKEIIVSGGAVQGTEDTAEDTTEEMEDTTTAELMAELKDLKEVNASLESKIAELTSQVEANNSEKAELVNSLKEAKEIMSEFKNMVITKDTKFEASQSFKNEKPKRSSIFDNQASEIKNKYANK